MNYIIVNENSGRQEPGDVSVYRDQEDAIKDIEAIDVRSGAYFCVFGDGCLARLVVTGDKVDIFRQDSKNIELTRQYVDYAWKNSRLLGREPIPSDFEMALERLSRL